MGIGRNNFHRLLYFRSSCQGIGFRLGEIHFKASKHKELSDYEIGHVKEGVGAGGFSMLANLKGYRNEEIVNMCQINLERMKEFCQISLDDDY